MLLLQVTPTLDLSNVSKILKEKNINPSQLKFGFLGLGIMGSGMVKNLINSGHSVIVWNRSPDKVSHNRYFCMLLLKCFHCIMWNSLVDSDSPN